MLWSNVIVVMIGISLARALPLLASTTSTSTPSTTLTVKSPCSTLTIIVLEADNEADFPSKSSFVGPFWGTATEVFDQPNNDSKHRNDVCDPIANDESSLPTGAVCRLPKAKGDQLSVPPKMREAVPDPSCYVLVLGLVLVLH